MSLPNPVRRANSRAVPALKFTLTTALECPYAINSAGPGWVGSSPALGEKALIVPPIRVRVLIADDHVDARERLQLLLSEGQDISATYAMHSHFG